jgi:hypothetical protein
MTMPKSTSGGSESWRASSIDIPQALAAEIDQAGSPLRATSLPRIASSPRIAELGASTPPSSGQRRSLGLIEQNLPPFMKRVDSMDAGSPKRVQVPWR